MNIREKKQKQFAEDWFIAGEYGILYLAPRFGKTFTAINILEKYKKNIKVLIAYPDKKIEQSWIDDFLKRGYVNPNIVFTTFRSLEKHEREVFDLIIIDEIHLLSEANLLVCMKLVSNCKKVLGLTGTLSLSTKSTLRTALGIRPVVTYSIEQAIADGIIPDYEIHVVTVPLDNKVIQTYKNRRCTEYARFSTFRYLIHKERQKKQQPNFFVRLKIIEVLQRSISKKAKTIELIKQFNDERLLIFCGRTEIADDLGIPSYHSNSDERGIFESFVKGDIKHLAIVKIGNTGVTYTPLSKVIINYFDSNSENLTQKVLRCMSMEYDNPEKKAVIYIVSSDRQIELEWLSKALAMFEKSKIIYHEEV